MHVSVKCVCSSPYDEVAITAMRKCLHSEVGSDKSGLKRYRARSTESHGSEEPLTRETLLAVTAPTIKSCCPISLEGSKPCSADVSVNSPHVCPTRAGENTLKLTYQDDRCEVRENQRVSRQTQVNHPSMDIPVRRGGCD